MGLLFDVDLCSPVLHAVVVLLVVADALAQAELRASFLEFGLFLTFVRFVAVRVDGHRALEAVLVAVFVMHHRRLLPGANV